MMMERVETWNKERVWGKACPGAHPSAHPSAHPRDRRRCLPSLLRATPDYSTFLSSL